MPGRLLVTLALIPMSLAGFGCALSPWDPDTHPPVTKMAIRITRGVGAAPPYHEAVSVIPPSTVQVRSLIGDGNTIIFEIPKGASGTQTIAATPVGGTGSSSVTVTDDGGGTIHLSHPAAFTPGYLGIEVHDDQDATRVRVAAPQLIDTPQRQVAFTFKLAVSGGKGS